MSEVQEMMTQQQFYIRLDHIEEQTAAMQERVDGYRDQQLAKLFVESEWSQDKLATDLSKKWGKEISQQWVSCRLRFGRFISFFTTNCSEDQWKLPRNFTEGAFRRYWEATEPSGRYDGHKAHTEAALKDEQRRFEQIINELKQSGLSRPQNLIRRAIAKKVTGKGWMTLEQIAQRISSDLDHPVSPSDVWNSLRRLMPSDKYPYRVEKAGDGDSAKYRVVKITSPMVSKKQIQKWSAELLPMLTDLVKEAKKDRVEISTGVLRSLADKIAKVLQSMTAIVPTEKTSKPLANTLSEGPTGKPEDEA